MKFRYLNCKIKYDIIQILEQMFYYCKGVFKMNNEIEKWLNKNNKVEWKYNVLTGNVYLSDFADMDVEFYEQYKKDTGVNITFEDFVFLVKGCLMFKADKSKCIIDNPFMAMLKVKFPDCYRLTIVQEHKLFMNFFDSLGIEHNTYDLAKSIEFFSKLYTSACANCVNQTTDELYVFVVDDAEQKEKFKLLIDTMCLHQLRDTTGSYIECMLPHLGSYVPMDKIIEITTFLTKYKSINSINYTILTPEEYSNTLKEKMAYPIRIKSSIENIEKLVEDNRGFACQHFWNNIALE